MAIHRRRVLAAFAVWTTVFTAKAAADQIWVASVTCINQSPNLNCGNASDSDQVWWRVINNLGQLNTPFPGSNNLLDVTLEFTYQGGSSTTHWDAIVPAVGPGDFGETEPFDALLVKQGVSLRLTATLPRTEFDPAYSGNPYLKFVADSPMVSGTTTQTPPPLGLDVYAQGQFIMNPTPEPATLTFVGLGMAGLLAGLRGRRRTL